MLHEIIALKDYYDLEFNPTLEVFCPKNLDIKGFNKRKAMLVLPGGGYAFCSNREADPIALEFCLKDYVAFKLEYSVNYVYRIHYPTQILEVMAAMDYIRKNKDKYNIDVDKIVLIGFSAGGHLAASYGYLYKSVELNKIIGVNKDDVKPNGLILSYPVITMGKYTHEGSMEYLTERKEELIELLSVEKHVDKDYPITFIWTTEDDNCVPSMNSKLMDEALTKAGVIHKTIIYEHGYHGLSLATKVVGVNKDDNGFSKEVLNWPTEADDFITENLDE